MLVNVNKMPPKRRHLSIYRVKLYFHPTAWSSRRPSARRPRCHTTTCTAPAPDRRLIPVTWWPGEHRPRPQAIAGTRRPRCRTPTGTAAAPARLLIPVTWWPGEHRHRYPQASMYHHDSHQPDWQTPAPGARDRQRLSPQRPCTATWICV